MIYKTLGKSGLRVSELCLGTMTFGTEWGYGADKDEAQKQYHAFKDLGGNFIDTANLYTNGTSENFVGSFTQGHREEMVIATKYSLKTGGNGPNAAGNSRKSMMESVEGSLKRLKTDYIDLFYLHAWDFLTPIDEIMRGLDDLVRQGKVLYLGISDTPAWIVSRANTTAELMGWSRFIALQVEYSLIQRTPERELVPMANALGLAITPWAPLAGGALSGKYLNPETAEGRVVPDSVRRNERATNITKVVVQIAEEKQCTPSQVALRWLLQKPETTIPIVGARSAAQLSDSLQAHNIKLSATEIDRLNEVSAIELGFPYDFLAQERVRDILFNGYYQKIKK